MPAQATTFTTLQADVRAYLERGASVATDPVVFAQIPRLIRLAEQRIIRELKIQQAINVVTGTLQPNKSVYRKPDRWRETVSINIGTGTGNNSRKTLFTRAYEYLRAYWPDPTVTDEPLFYTDYNQENWLFAPTPDAAYPFEVVFYQLPELLDDQTQTNWMTEHIPELLLYATLLEAAPFLKNDERIATWSNLYDRAAAMINGEDLAKILDRAAVRDKP